MTMHYTEASRKARAILLVDVANRKGPNSFRRGDTVWISPSFPGPKNEFFDIIRGEHDGAAILISEVHKSAFQLFAGSRWPVSGMGHG